MAAVRKGIITFGLVSIPVELHVAARAKSIDFDLLHRACKTRIKYQPYCPTHESAVSRKELVKGYRTNGYVVMEDEDFEKAERASSRAIEVVEFVDLADVDPLYLERSYYVGPQEDTERPYEVLLQALTESKKAAVARFVMSNRQQYALLRAAEDTLVLHTLYYADEVRAFEAEWKRARPGPEEVKLATRFIEALAKDFDPSKYHDEYREMLDDVIRAKAEGQEVTLPEAPKPSRKVVNLMDALRESVEQIRKPPARAAGRGGRASGARGRAVAGERRRRRKAA